jgi:hypothetical protein
MCVIKNPRFVPKTGVGLEVFSSADRPSTFADSFGGPVTLRRRVAPVLLFSENCRAVDQTKKASVADGWRNLKIIRDARVRTNEPEFTSTSSPQRQQLDAVSVEKNYGVILILLVAKLKGINCPYLITILSTVSCPL